MTYYKWRSREDFSRYMHIFSLLHSEQVLFGGTKNSRSSGFVTAGTGMACIYACMYEHTFEVFSYSTCKCGPVFGCCQIWGNANGSNVFVYCFRCRHNEKDSGKSPNIAAVQTTNDNGRRFVSNGVMNINYIAALRQRVFSVFVMAELSLGCLKWQ